jgi:hypothetical protein
MAVFTTASIKKFGISLAIVALPVYVVLEGNNILKIRQKETKEKVCEY